MGAIATGRSGVGSEHFHPPIGDASSSVTRCWMASAASTSPGRQASGRRSPGRCMRRAATRKAAAFSVMEDIVLFTLAQRERQPERNKDQGSEIADQNDRRHLARLLIILLGNHEVEHCRRQTA